MKKSNDASQRPPRRGANTPLRQPGMVVNTTYPDTPALTSTPHLAAVTPAQSLFAPSRSTPCTAAAGNVRNRFMQGAASPLPTLPSTSAPPVSRGSARRTLYQPPARPAAVVVSVSSIGRPQPSAPTSPPLAASVQRQPPTVSTAASTSSVPAPMAGAHAPAATPTHAPTRAASAGDIFAFPYLSQSQYSRATAPPAHTQPQTTALAPHAATAMPTPPRPSALANPAPATVLPPSPTRGSPMPSARSASTSTVALLASLLVPAPPPSPPSPPTRAHGTRTRACRLRSPDSLSALTSVSRTRGVRGTSPPSHAGADAADAWQWVSAPVLHGARSHAAETEHDATRSPTQSRPLPTPAPASPAATATAATAPPVSSAQLTPSRSALLPLLRATTLSRVDLLRLLHTHTPLELLRAHARDSAAALECERELARLMGGTCPPTADTAHAGGPRSPATRTPTRTTMRAPSATTTRSRTRPATGVRAASPGALPLSAWLARTHVDADIHTGASTPASAPPPAASLPRVRPRDLFAEDSQPLSPPSPLFSSFSSPTSTNTSIVTDNAAAAAAVAAAPLAGERAGDIAEAAAVPLEVERDVAGSVTLSAAARASGTQPPVPAVAAPDEAARTTAATTIGATTAVGTAAHALTRGSASSIVDAEAAAAERRARLRARARATGARWRREEEVDIVTVRTPRRTQQPVSASTGVPADVEVVSLDSDSDSDSAREGEQVDARDTHPAVLTAATQQAVREDEDEGRGERMAQMASPPSATGVDEAFEDENANVSEIESASESLFVRELTQLTQALLSEAEETEEEAEEEVREDEETVERPRARGPTASRPQLPPATTSISTFTSAAARQAVTAARMPLWTPPSARAATVADTFSSSSSSSSPMPRRAAPVLLHTPSPSHDPARGWAARAHGREEEHPPPRRARALWAPAHSPAHSPVHSPARSRAAIAMEGVGAAGMYTDEEEEGEEEVGYGEYARARHRRHVSSPSHSPARAPRPHARDSSSPSTPARAGVSGSPSPHSPFSPASAPASPADWAHWSQWSQAAAGTESVGLSQDANARIVAGASAVPTGVPIAAAPEAPVDVLPSPLLLAAKGSVRVPTVPLHASLAMHSHTLRAHAPALAAAYAHLQRTLSTAVSHASASATACVAVTSAASSPSPLLLCLALMHMQHHHPHALPLMRTHATVAAAASAAAAHSLYLSLLAHTLTRTHPSATLVLATHVCPGVLSLLQATVCEYVHLCLPLPMATAHKTDTDAGATNAGDAAAAVSGSPPLSLAALHQCLAHLLAAVPLPASLLLTAFPALAPDACNADEDPGSGVRSAGVAVSEPPVSSWEQLLAPALPLPLPHLPPSLAHTPLAPAAHTALPSVLALSARLPAAHPTYTAQLALHATATLARLRARALALLAVVAATVVHVCALAVRAGELPATLAAALAVEDSAQPSSATTEGDGEANGYVGDEDDDNADASPVADSGQLHAALALLRTHANTRATHAGHASVVPPALTFPTLPLPPTQLLLPCSPLHAYVYADADRYMHTYTHTHALAHGLARGRATSQPLPAPLLPHARARTDEDALVLAMQYHHDTRLLPPPWQPHAAGAGAGSASSPPPLRVAVCVTDAGVAVRVAHSPPHRALPTASARSQVQPLAVYGTADALPDLLPHERTLTAALPPSGGALVPVTTCAGTSAAESGAATSQGAHLGHVLRPDSPPHLPLPPQPLAPPPPPRASAPESAYAYLARLRRPVQLCAGLTARGCGDGDGAVVDEAACAPQSGFTSALDVLPLPLRLLASLPALTPTPVSARVRIALAERSPRVPRVLTPAPSHTCTSCTSSTLSSLAGLPSLSPLSALMRQLVLQLPLRATVLRVLDDDLRPAPRLLPARDAHTRPGHTCCGAVGGAFAPSAADSDGIGDGDCASASDDPRMLLQPVLLATHPLLAAHAHTFAGLTSSLARGPDFVPALDPTATAKTTALSAVVSVDAVTGAGSSGAASPRSTPSPLAAVAPVRVLCAVQAILAPRDHTRTHTPVRPGGVASTTAHTADEATPSSAYPSLDSLSASTSSLLDRALPEPWLPSAWLLAPPVLVEMHLPAHTLAPLAHTLARTHTHAADASDVPPPAASAPPPPICAGLALTLLPPFTVAPSHTLATATRYRGPHTALAEAAALHDGALLAEGAAHAWTARGGLPPDTPVSGKLADAAIETIEDGAQDTEASMSTVVQLRAAARALEAAASEVALHRHACGEGPLAACRGGVWFTEAGDIGGCGRVSSSGLPEEGEVGMDARTEVPLRVRVSGDRVVCEVQAAGAGEGEEGAEEQESGEEDGDAAACSCTWADECACAGGLVAHDASVEAVDMVIPATRRPLRRLFAELHHWRRMCVALAHTEAHAHAHGLEPVAAPRLTQPDAISAAASACVRSVLADVCAPVRLEGALPHWLHAAHAPPLSADGERPASLLLALPLLSAAAACPLDWPAMGHVRLAPPSRPCPRNVALWEDHGPHTHNDGAAIGAEVGGDGKGDGVATAGAAAVASVGHTSATTHAPSAATNTPPTTHASASPMSVSPIRALVLPAVHVAASRHRPVPPSPTHTPSLLPHSTHAPPRPRYVPLLLPRALLPQLFPRAPVALTVAAVPDAPHALALLARALAPALTPRAAASLAADAAALAAASAECLYAPRQDASVVDAPMPSRPPMLLPLSACVLQAHCPLILPPLPPRSQRASLADVDAVADAQWQLLRVRAAACIRTTAAWAAGLRERIIGFPGHAAYADATPTTPQHAHAATDATDARDAAGVLPRSRRRARAAEDKEGQPAGTPRASPFYQSAADANATAAVADAYTHSPARKRARAGHTQPHDTPRMPARTPRKPTSPAIAPAAPSPGPSPAHATHAARSTSHALSGTTPAAFPSLLMRASRGAVLSAHCLVTRATAHRHVLPLLTSAHMHTPDMSADGSSPWSYVPRVVLALHWRRPLPLPRSPQWSPLSALPAARADQHVSWLIRTHATDDMPGSYTPPHLLPLHDYLRTLTITLTHTTHGPQLSLPLAVLAPPRPPPVTLALTRAMTPSLHAHAGNIHRVLALHLRARARWLAHLPLPPAALPSAGLPLLPLAALASPPLAPFLLPCRLVGLYRHIPTSTFTLILADAHIRASTLAPASTHTAHLSLLLLRLAPSTNTCAWLEHTLRGTPLRAAAPLLLPVDGRALSRSRYTMPSRPLPPLLAEPSMLTSVAVAAHCPLPTPLAALSPQPLVVCGGVAQLADATHALAHAGKQYISAHHADGAVDGVVAAVRKSLAEEEEEDMFAGFEGHLLASLPTSQDTSADAAADTDAGRDTKIATADGHAATTQDAVAVAARDATSDAAVLDALPPVPLPLRVSWGSQLCAGEAVLAPEDPDAAAWECAPEQARWSVWWSAVPDAADHAIPDPTVAAPATRSPTSLSSTWASLPRSLSALQLDEAAQRALEVATAVPNSNGLCAAVRVNATMTSTDTSSRSAGPSALSVPPAGSVSVASSSAVAPLVPLRPSPAVLAVARGVLQSASGMRTLATRATHVALITPPTASDAVLLSASPPPFLSTPVPLQAVRAAERLSLRGQPLAPPTMLTSATVVLARGAKTACDDALSPRCGTGEAAVCRYGLDAQGSLVPISTPADACVNAPNHRIPAKAVATSDAPTNDITDVDDAQWLCGALVLVLVAQRLEERGLECVCGSGWSAAHTLTSLEVTPDAAVPARSRGAFARSRRGARTVNVSLRRSSTANHPSREIPAPVSTCVCTQVREEVCSQLRTIGGFTATVVDAAYHAPLTTEAVSAEQGAAVVRVVHEAKRRRTTAVSAAWPEQAAGQERGWALAAAAAEALGT